MVAPATTVAARAAHFLSAERPVGNVLGEEQVVAQAVAATRMYAAYGKLASEAVDVDSATVVSASEWGVIHPLFLLYVERENALQLEASRGLGVDVFGRDSATIAGDVLQAEQSLPLRAFGRPILTV